MKHILKGILAKMLPAKYARQLYCDNYGHPVSESECNATNHWCGLCGTKITEEQWACDACDSWWDYNLVDSATKVCPVCGKRLTPPKPLKEIVGG